MRYSRGFRFVGLAPLAASLILAGERPAEAVLTYYIYESGSNVVAQTSGSLNLPSSTTIISCPSNAAQLWPSAGVICTGTNPANLTKFGLVNAGPSSFGTVGQVTTTSVTGIQTGLFISNRAFAIDPTYVSNSSIVSSATFSGQSLSSLGITSTGLIGTWTINGTSETINVVVGAPPSPSASVPGPLPLLGATAAFGFSRRLRRRVSAFSSYSNRAHSTSA